MRSKLADEVKRWTMIAPVDWFEQIEDWRRQQPNPMPGVSESIRRLVEIGLEQSTAKPKSKPNKRQHAA